MDNKNETREFMNDSFGDHKADKSKELNAGMTIAPSERDEYESTIHTLRK